MVLRRRAGVNTGPSMPTFLSQVAAVGDAEDGDRRHVQPFLGQPGAAPGRGQLPQDGPGEEQRLGRPRQAHAHELQEEYA